MADGRWHTRGRSIVYCAASAVLAVLEVRAPLDLPLELLPDDYVLMQITAPDDLEMRVVRASDLPTDWRENEEACRHAGDAWLHDMINALLAVPSAIIEVERNVLVNPRHPDAAGVRVAKVVPFQWDRRLFQLS